MKRAWKRPRRGSVKRGSEEWGSRRRWRGVGQVAVQRGRNLDPPFPGTPKVKSRFYYYLEPTYRKRFALLQIWMPKSPGSTFHIKVLVFQRALRALRVCFCSAEQWRLWLLRVGRGHYAPWWSQATKRSGYTKRSYFDCLFSKSNGFNKSIDAFMFNHEAWDLWYNREKASK